MMKPLYAIRQSDAKLHISKGNSKIGKGIWSFSTLPGNQDNMLTIGETTLLTDIPGTCSKYCEGCFDKGCYAVKSAKLHHNAVIRAWAENTVLLRSGKLFGEIDAFISRKNSRYARTGLDSDIRVRTFRINVSGEVQSADEFRSWDGMARRHPEVTFSVYTKNFEALEEFIQGAGGTQPNFVVNVSQWHHCADGMIARHPGEFNVFEYDDSNLRGNGLSDEDLKRLGSMHHCPAVTQSGHHAKDADGNPLTCDRCMRCYRKCGSKTAVYAH